jgi:uncharacterized protein
MRRVADGLLYSPSDLTGFMDSSFASWMTRLALEHPERIPAQDDPPAGPVEDIDRILREHGDAHEREVLELLRAAGRDVAEIPDAADALERTLRAMRSGREIVYQGHLRLPLFAGVADFLVRIDEPSRLGDHGYEVWDAKLARRARPYFLVQLCAYAEMLEAVQGWRPERVRVVLGSSESRAFRTDDHFFFYRFLKQAFLDFMAGFDPERPPIPEMGANHRRWSAHAERLLEERDHPSRVAHITRGQVRRLAERGIETLTDLASTTLSRVPRIQERTFARLKDQAALQRESAGRARPLHRVLTPDPDEPRKGLARLPPASPLDVYFDLEGYPLVEGGLEYLFGVATREGEEIRYRDWWAHDPAGEKAAFEGLIDWVAERRRRDPGMHVHHYGAYEVGALRRLMGRYGTREEQVDALLRGGVFVDLYAVVRNGLLVGEPRYSIKNLERLYMAGREAGVESGMESVAYYEAWIGGGESPDWRESPLLREIRDYNREDCASTLLLAEWLRERQAEAGIAYLEQPTRDEEEERAAELGEEDRARKQLAEQLLDAIPRDPDERSRESERWTLQEMLAHLLEFHRREMKPVYWALHHRCDLTEEERALDLDCLAGLERTPADPVPIKRSLGFEYRFDPDQDTKIRGGESCRIAQHRNLAVKVEELDAASGRALLKLSRRSLERCGLHELPPRLCLVLHDYVGPGRIVEAIHDTARSWHESRELAPALRDFLLRRPPRVRGHGAGPLVGEGEDRESAVRRLSAALDGSTLCIQGPPGAGKTRNAARAILDLLEDGRRVGISSNSHSAILNLMGECARMAGGTLACAKVGGDPEAAFFRECPDARYVGSAADLPAWQRLVGGTAWTFSHPELRGAFDHLFVDEAGQVSIANLVGMSRAAKNLVLVGHQMQLGQPIQGAHPGESGLSTLEYLLQDHATIPAERGVFLDRTWRLHPEICRFVSGAVYEDRLEPAPGNERRIVRLPQEGGRRIRAEAGLVFVPCLHEGNTQASDEEVALVAEIVDELLGRELTDERGDVRGALSLSEILVVAPYNMQVRRLQEALGARDQVGSVDKFQGRQAPVVIVSMCASDTSSAPRGVEFLLDRNRLNVAISRAQSLAIVVGSPALAHTPCSTIHQMQLVNLFCRILEQGGHPAADVASRLPESRH